MHGDEISWGPTPYPLLLATLVLVATAASGQDPEQRCDLQAVQEDYDLGRFEGALSQLDACLDRGLGTREAVAVYALQAKTYLVLDELKAADQAISRLLSLNPSYVADFSDPPRFVERVTHATRGRQTLTVTSVSKTAEDPREVPATLVVLTGEEIMERGYLDLAAVLHDLAGFDISRGSGDLYSNFYQRGYRAANDRTLFLVDGVEENDLWENSAWLSRQYALSNIDRVEVIYGPASTTYGPNAFVGTINVITKEPQDLVEEDETFAVKALVGAGTWDTFYADTTVAGRLAGGKVSFSLTSRVYRSDEMDLSGFEDWDFDPSFYDGVDYENKLFVPLAADGSVPPGVPHPDASPLVRFASNGDGNPGVTASAEGVALARDLDKRALGRLVEGSPVGFSDRTDDWSIYGKLRIQNVTLGFQTWRREEGLGGWYSDQFYPGADNGALWIPKQSAFYLRYQADLGERLRLTLFSRFKRHRFDGSQEQQLRNYARGALDLPDLAAGIDSFWRRTLFDQRSRQFRNEVTLLYEQLPRFSLFSGVEVRNSLIQGDYIFTIDCPDREARLCPKGESENRRDDSGQFFDQLDFGVFGQLVYRYRDHWKLVLGGRIDHNEITSTGGTVAIAVVDPDGSERVFRPRGYGTVFNPRLAVIYSRDQYVLKAIYAEAFKDASNFNRFATSPGLRETPSPALRPENVKNVEVAAGWHPDEAVTVELSAYRARYNDAVDRRQVRLPSGSFDVQNQNLGALEILGVQARLDWQHKNYRIYANYTYTDPRNTNPLDSRGEPLLDPLGREINELRIGDIARHQVNAGLSHRFRNHLAFSLRLNYVGDRETGLQTTVRSTIRDQVEGYVVSNLALSYKHPRLLGAQLQLLVNNLFDRQYAHPGVNSADGVFLVSRLPQPERSVFLRLGYGF